MKDAASSAGCSPLRIEVPVGSRRRWALACLPEAAAPAAGWPVVLAFHGGRTHPEMMRSFSGLDSLAAAGRALVVFPAGSGSREALLTWNGGNCCGEAHADAVDDVTFVRVLLDELQARLPVDLRRVHATGMSNGAMMAHRVASEIADRIASIAPVAGPVALDAVAPLRPVPVLCFHGTRDEFTPLEGGIGRRSVTRVGHRPIVDGLLDWVRANGCDDKPALQPIPCSDEGLVVERLTWGAGRAGSEVVFYRIDGGGHTWPGRKPESFFLGRSALSLDATALMWEFFARHPRP